MNERIRQLTQVQHMLPAAPESAFDELAIYEVSLHKSAASRAEHHKTAAVYIAPYALDLLQRNDIHDPFGLVTRRNLDLVTHFAFAIGLGISVVLMIGGILLGLALQIDSPGIIPALHVTPEQMLTLGLVVLIATPLVQVIDSMVIFVYEHDWGFVGVTIGVLLVVLVSILISNGR